MKPLKLNVKILDKDQIYNAKGKYYPESKILTVKKRALSRETLDFAVNPDHFRLEVGSRKEYCVFVDLATRQSIDVKGDKQTKWDVANQLDFHTEKAFWKALMQSHKIPLSTLLITMFAGYGVIRFIEWLFFAIFAGGK